MSVATCSDLDIEQAFVDPLSENPRRPNDRADVPLAGVIEMLLKDQADLDARLRTVEGQRSLIPKLLAVALGGFLLYGTVVTVILNGLWTSNDFWLAGIPAAHWNDASIANLALAYSLGLIAANGICLPSFYFYGLLAGVRTTMLGVTAHALKGMAAGALALVGILPIYVAVALSGVVSAPSHWLLGCWAALGLALPFVAGVWGAICLYRGFVGLCDTMSDARRGSRACFLRRLILAWSGCYTLVTPLVIYTLWNHLGRLSEHLGSP